MVGDQGVYEALKHQNPALHRQLLSQKEYNWLPKPNVPYEPGMESYFTPEGAAKYEQTAYPIHQKHLKDLQRMERDIDPKSIVYSDPYQVVIKQSAALSREEIHSYYAHPTTKDRILPHLLNKNVAVRLGVGPESVLKRVGEDDKPLHLSHESGQSPDTYQYWIERRANEILPEYAAHSDHLLVDIDPGPSASWQRTKQITEHIQQELAKHPDVQHTTVTFTGGRGFHVRGHLANSIPIDEARELSTQLSARAIEHAGELGSHDLTLHPTTQDHQIRLDTTPLRTRGIVRVPYTLNEQTGLIAVPVTDLQSFEREHASPAHVFGGTMPSIAPQRPFGSSHKG